MVDGLGRLFRELGGNVRLNTPVGRIITEGGRAVGAERRTGRGSRRTRWYRMRMWRTPIERWFRRRTGAGGPIRRSTACATAWVCSSFISARGGIIRTLSTIRFCLVNAMRGCLTISSGRRYWATISHLSAPADRDRSFDGAGGTRLFLCGDSGAESIEWHRLAHRSQAVPRPSDGLYGEALLPGLESRLVTERLFTPLDFETTLNTYRGSGFSLNRSSRNRHGSGLITRARTLGDCFSGRWDASGRGRAGRAFFG